MQLNQCARLAVAPMMDLTDRHYRYLARLLSKRTVLYTEMLTSSAIVHGDRQRLLDYNAEEQPLILQLGGSEPGEMAEAAAIGEAWGYREINMNVGCPSDRVQAGRFGACLMAEPKLVADNVTAMQAAVSIPVTVKCRLGIDRNDSYAALSDFVAEVADAGCEHFIVHARKAWLDGLSPKENRTVPPLRYDYVYQLKQERPELQITINGGIDTWSDVLAHWQRVDGVMCGRTPYYQPAFLYGADQYLAASEADAGTAVMPPPEPQLEALANIARDYGKYMYGQQQQGVPLSVMTRHLIALFQDVPGARKWRRYLSEKRAEADDVRVLVDGALQQVLPEQPRPLP